MATPFHGKLIDFSMSDFRRDIAMVIKNWIKGAISEFPESDHFVLIDKDHRTFFIPIEGGFKTCNLAKRRKKILLEINQLGNVNCKTATDNFIEFLKESYKIVRREGLIDESYYTILSIMDVEWIENECLVTFSIIDTNIPEVIQYFQNIKWTIPEST